MNHPNGPTQANSIAPLRDFVQTMTRIVEAYVDEQDILDQASDALGGLLRNDQWLADAYAQAPAGAYRQYLLHCDPLERFSVVSFAWGPGAATPIHDHTVWGLIGVLRGAERCDEFKLADDGSVDPQGCDHLMMPGMIDRVSPTIGDWHKVSNAVPDQTSVSIHVYGGNIGAIRRHRLGTHRSDILDFISGYSSVHVPNLWDRSSEAGAVNPR
jgi:predicted metal-dependent enzyme (double-stranded beta helix superfamily)